MLDQTHQAHLTTPQSAPGFIQGSLSILGGIIRFFIQITTSYTCALLRYEQPGELLLDRHLAPIRNRDKN